MGRRSAEIKEEVIVVAIDKDKGSQYALKWAVDHLFNRGQSLTLLHIQQRTSVTNLSGNSGILSGINDELARNYQKQQHSQANEMFLPFRCFCTRKDLKCNEILVEDMDIPRAIADYASKNSVDILVLGSPSRTGIMRRFKMTDVPSTVSKTAPDFCTVYVIGKGKIASVRSSTAAAPKRLPNQSYSGYSEASASSSTFSTPRDTPRQSERISSSSNDSFSGDMDIIRSPFTRGRAPVGKYEPPQIESDISFVSSGRPSADRAPPPSLYDSKESGNWYPSSSEYDHISFRSSNTANKSSEMSYYPNNFSSNTQETSSTWSSQSTDDVEAEMQRLRQELQQTMNMYNTACKEAIVAQHKAKEVHRWKMEEEQKLEDAQLSEKGALALVEKEQAKSKAAMEAAEASQRLAQLEAQKRKSVENKAQLADERKQTMSKIDCRYRRYTIEEIEAATENYAVSRKIGEGGYGPVYKCYLDHTPVAVKILGQDANQGRAQFNQEVEVLSRMRHPNMVLLLGACPEYGCLVYELMANGSLEDCLFRRGKNPPLPWQARFRIAAEIATGLLFLHQSKPEPLVHRDLKPGNILLDRNYVSKISDVGLARLVPPSVADNVTQYHMTATAGTFCYIDPEYQQTGMLGTKSDVYSLGIMLLQIITAKPPMGVTHHVKRAIEKGTFTEMLDPAITDWPIEEALCFAKLSLQCAELRRKDRPDLGKVVLPELDRLRALAEESTPSYMYGGSHTMQAQQYHASGSSSQDVFSDRQCPPRTSGYDSRDST
ncbi:hypothetical protein ACFE04_025020 [Oxalis oulophora]